MLLFVGLGNPGAKHVWNRHNVGYMALDAIAQRYRFGSYRRRFQGEIAEGHIAGTRVLGLKPTTFMNESGRAVGEVTRFYKLQLDSIVVLYDELDLAPGKLRVKTGGGAGGHNGIRSIDAHIGKAYRRVRIGIGHPGQRDMVHGYVLKDFAKADQEWLDRMLPAIADAAPELVRGDDANFMNKVALVMNPRPPKSDTPSTDRQASD